MEIIALDAKTRTVLGKKVNTIRHKGFIPGVVYGPKLKNTPIAIDAKEFQVVYKKAGTSALVDLKIDDEKPIKVLLHEPQEHYLTGKPVHIDFYAVKMDEKIETAIPVKFVGVSPAVEELEGNFVSSKDEIEIRCLPADLIPEIEVDISVLKSFDDVIRVSDLNLPETIEIMQEPEEAIASVSAPISEAELEAELAEDKAAEEAAVGELGGEGEESAGAETEGGEAAPAEEKPQE
jgi:large subunit ribosomal protein L25